ncbi:MAG: hypothetical protein K0M50_09820 [Prolixibacteraceae bacterium]|nr:hypothetical protein [Prolixibacteraceae bacterium]
MKKPIAILFLITLFSCSTPPKPEGVILKVQYQPEKTYHISTIRGTETVITYSGQEIAMRKLKSMRVKNPTISKVRTKTDAELVTGKSSADSSFQANLTYKKIMSLDGNNEIPEGTVVQGEIKGEELPAFNKVVSNTLSIDQRIQLLQTVQNTFEQFKFPEQRLKIGDQFSVDRPTLMAMESSTIDIVVTTTYTLLSIKNDIAQFELSQSYLMTPKTMDNSFTGTGSGKGQLSYDIANFLITDYSIKTELEMNKKLDYYEFDLKTVNEFSQTTQMGKQ